MVSFQLINIILQSFHQQLDIYLYDLCSIIKSGLDTFHSSINEISLDTVNLIYIYIYNFMFVDYFILFLYTTSLY